MHELRDYQAEIVRDTVKHLRRNTRAQVRMACGSGKTLVGMRILETLVRGRDRSVIVLGFPNLALLSQTLHYWREQSTWRTALGRRAYADIVVGSDVATGEPDEAGDVDVDSPHDSLAELGLVGHDITITTSPHALADLISTTPGRVVIFSTYQSMSAVAAAARMLRERGDGTFRYDAVLADEAHRTAGDATTDAFADVVLPRAMPVAKRLFMTATPRHVVSRRRAPGVRSMDNEGQYGKVTGDFPMRRGIDVGVLSDYQVNVLGVNLEELEAVTGVTVQVPDGTAGARWLRESATGRRAHLDTVAVAVAKLAAFHGRSRIMVFHSRIDRSREFIERLQQVVARMPALASRPVLPVHVDGNTSADDRRDVLQRMNNLDLDKGEWAVVSNVGVFVEGVDVPLLDAVVLAEPRRSPVDVTQIVGRALRLPHHSQRSYHRPAAIMVPVLVLPGQHVASALHTGSFAITAELIRVLRIDDSTITDKFVPAIAPRQRHRAKARRSEDGTVSFVLDGGLVEYIPVPSAQVDALAPTESQEQAVPAERRHPSTGSTAGPMGQEDAGRSHDDPASAPTTDPPQTPDVPSQPQHPVILIEEAGARGVLNDPPQPRPRQRPKVNRVYYRTSELDSDGLGWVLALEDTPTDQRVLVDSDDLRLDSLLRSVTVTAAEIAVEPDALVATRIAEFLSVRLRWPQAKADDPAEAQWGRRLRSWQKAAADGDAYGLPDGGTALLDRIIPGWRDLAGTQAREHLFHQSVLTARDFIAANGRDPDPRSSDTVERNSARFLIQQREYAARPAARRAVLLPPERVAMLDEAIPGWNDRKRRKAH